MRDITVTYEDGNTISTSINGSKETIREYYIGTYFQHGDTEEHPTDKMVKAVAVEFHPKRYRVSWKKGRKAGALGVFYPDSVTVEAETPEAARLKAYETHEHLMFVTIEEVAS